ncbi:MAG: IclR family transcriptional regulator [Gemmatimonadales bacterium]
MRISIAATQPVSPTPRVHNRDAGPRALGRALEVLEALARRRDGATLSGLSQRLGSPKSSLLYLLRPMTRLGYLVRSPDGRYQLGPSAFTLAMAALSNRELPELARPFLAELVDESGETALIATMAADAPFAVYVDKVESRNPIRYTVSIGDRRPLYCSAIGKLLLAYLPLARRQEYLKTTRLKAFTPQTPVTRASLRRALDEIRSTGLSVSVDEIAQGSAGIAAPVFDRHGQVLAGLVLGAPSQRVLAEQPRLAALVIESARGLSRVMGFGAEGNG